jgi:hypothetical protein
MISKLKEAAASARLKACVWLRERKERAEERKQATEPPGVTIPLSLVRSAHLASWMAYFALVYFLWLYTLDIARDRAASLHITHAGAWIGELHFYFPYIIGFAIVAVGIPYVAKIAIPTFMSLRWRGHFWPKLWALFIAVAVSLVVVAGTFTVQGDTIMERDRESAVAVEQVQQGRAALEAQIESRRQELADMMNNSNAYLAQAASVGAAEWQRSYIDQTPANDPQRDRIVRALGAARSADTLRAELSALRQQLATSATTASVQGEVVTERTGWIADTLGWLEGARAILLSLVMDMVCLIMPWIALRLEQARNAQLGMAEGIPRHSYMLSDERKSANHASFKDPARRSAQDVVDAMIAGGADPRFAADMARSAARSSVADEIALDEDGTPLTEVRYYKRADGKPLVKNQKNRVIVPPGPPMPDETGVDHDGGGRVGSVAAPEQADHEVHEVRENATERDERNPSDEAVNEASSVQVEPSNNPDYSDEELAAIERELATAENEPVDNEDASADTRDDAEANERHAEASDENVLDDAQDTPPREEPETNERRMIAAE